MASLVFLLYIFINKFLYSLSTIDDFMFELTRYFNQGSKSHELKSFYLTISTEGSLVTRGPEVNIIFRI